MGGVQGDTAEGAGGHAGTRVGGGVYRWVSKAGKGMDAGRVWGVVWGGLIPQLSCLCPGTRAPEHQSGGVERSPASAPGPATRGTHGSGVGLRVRV